ncbi:MAG TPA: magnesium chelatase [Flavobacteriales bacterium]|nr:magnesium chelatase [Flavobacteriales bacterium]
MEKITQLSRFGELKKSGYVSHPIKDELRNNLIIKLKANEPVFEGILGYEKTVIPEIQRAILSRHNINLLGLRGQAKTRIARQMTSLLDEYIPVIDGSETNDDPFNPVSHFGKEKIALLGDETPIRWMHRSERFVEKLATPDVTVADLIGDIDPIKAANLKISYADERAIHFGLIPRSNRCIFVINELPDLQARIQVALFNILQEGDIQIRGFRMRLPLDLQFVFTANPEDYTNRGSIVTPLKDRIQSQIVTHYPKNIEIAKTITRQEAKLPAQQSEMVTIPELIRDLIEQVSFEARNSEYVDAKSGVSARLSISALENTVSAAERRALIQNEKHTTARISDLWGAISAINGKIELVYEGEQEGPVHVAQFLIAKAIRTLFVNYFPDPERFKRKKEANPYETILNWFNSNHEIDLMLEDKTANYANKLKSVNGLKELIDQFYKSLSENDKLLLMEFVLYGLAAFSQLNRLALDNGMLFKDLFSSVFSADDLDDEFSAN